MCGICGCGEPDVRHQHDDHHHDHHHVETAGASRLIRVEADILAHNDAHAAANRGAFERDGILVLNLVSSPGAGKTALLERSLRDLKDHLELSVIEGDQQTDLDATRIRETGVRALQVNTGKGCHLDAVMIEHAYERLAPPPGGVLFVENVGNLVCPAGFDLGEAHKVILASVTEGEDKPLKYPNMFAAASLMLVTKTDLLPHLDFDVDALIANAKRINPDLRVVSVSVRTGEGLAAWYDWIEEMRHGLTGANAAIPRTSAASPA
jgi:hydrogenase nickel incorporation protein HypB